MQDKIRGGFSYEQTTTDPADAISFVKEDLANFLKYQEITDAAASTSDLDADLIRAVIFVESRFKHDARSKKGATGLMQLTPLTGASLGVRNLKDPKENVMGGSRYLRILLDRFEGDHRLALAAYNAGPTAVRRHQGVPPYPETQKYVKKVLGTYALLRERSEM